MRFLIEFFIIVLFINGVLLATGYLILAHFRLAPQPEWMKKRQQPKQRTANAWVDELFGESVAIVRKPESGGTKVISLTEVIGLTDALILHAARDFVVDPKTFPQKHETGPDVVTSVGAYFSVPTTPETKTATG